MSRSTACWAEDSRTPCYTLLLPAATIVIVDYPHKKKGVVPQQSAKYETNPTVWLQLRYIYISIDIVYKDQNDHYIVTVASAYA